MNILITNYEYPPVGAGAANASRRIAIALNELGHAVTVPVKSVGKSGYSRIFYSAHNRGTKPKEDPSGKAVEGNARNVPLLAITAFSGVTTYPVFWCVPHQICTCHRETHKRTAENAGPVRPMGLRCKLTTEIRGSIL